MDIEAPSEFNAAMLNLYRMTSVAGLLLQRGKNTLANHMPFSDQRNSQLAELIATMSEGYVSVKRRLRQVLITYDGGSLLIIIHKDVQLAILMTSKGDIDGISKYASLFMLENAAKFIADQPVEVKAPVQVAAVIPVVVQAPEPVVVAVKEPVREVVVEVPKEVSRWPEIRIVIDNVLGKVMGRAQITNMVERVSLEKGIADLTQLALPQAIKLAFAVLEEIPNRNKKASLISEMQHIFEEKNLGTPSWT
ncbi:hypothetical protein BH11VER1_BH11VER1_25940 [soil metagenome]